MQCLVFSSYKKQVGPLGKEAEKKNRVDNKQKEKKDIMKLAINNRGKLASNQEKKGKGERQEGIVRKDGNNSEMLNYYHRRRKRRTGLTVDLPRRRPNGTYIILSSLFFWH